VKKKDQKPPLLIPADQKKKENEKKRKGKKTHGLRRRAATVALMTLLCTLCFHIISLLRTRAAASDAFPPAHPPATQMTASRGLADGRASLTVAD
jgi:hypothetical protein